MRLKLGIRHRLKPAWLPDHAGFFVPAPYDHRNRIQEHGTHDELLSSGGLYARLYREQYGSGLIEAYCEDGVVYSDGSVAPLDAAEPAIAARHG